MNGRRTSREKSYNSMRDKNGHSIRMGATMKHKPSIELSKILFKAGITSVNTYAEMTREEK